MVQPVKVKPVGVPDWTEDQLNAYLHGHVELPGHTKHNKGITCARCTLNTRLKHLRKATGIYLTVERPKQTTRIKAQKRSIKKESVSSPRGPRQRRATAGHRRSSAPGVTPLAVDPSEAESLELMRRVLHGLRTVLDETGERFIADEIWANPSREERPEFYRALNGRRPVSLQMIHERLHPANHAAAAAAYPLSAFESDMKQVLAHTIERGVALEDSIRLEGAFTNLMEEEAQRTAQGPGHRARLTVSQAVSAEDQEEEDIWQKHIRERARLEKEEKRIVRTWQEERDQLLANRWMFKRTKTSEERRQAQEFERLVNYNLGEGTEFFEGFAVAQLDETSSDDVVREEIPIPAIIDHGGDQGSDFDPNATSAYRKNHKEGYIRWDFGEEDLQLGSPRVATPRAGGSHQRKPSSPRKKSHKRVSGLPRTPRSRSVSTVPAVSVSPYESDTLSPNESLSDGFNFFDEVDTEMGFAGVWNPYGGAARRKRKAEDEIIDHSNRGRARRAPAHHKNYLV